MSSFCRPTNTVSAAPAVRRPVRLWTCLASQAGTGSFLPFRVSGGSSFAGDRLPGELAGELTDDDAVRRRGGFEAGGGVDRVACQEALSGGGIDVGVEVDFTGVHTDVDLHSIAIRPRELADLLNQSERALHGPLGIVVVGSREAEDGDNGVADVLLDDAAICLHKPLGQGAVALQQAVDQLVVGGF